VYHLSIRLQRFVLPIWGEEVANDSTFQDKYCIVELVKRAGKAFYSIAGKYRPEFHS
jgi:hypothetical protein